jgi:hypothetical protein
MCPIGLIEPSQPTSLSHPSIIQAPTGLNAPAITTNAPANQHLSVQELTPLALPALLMNNVG